MAASSDCVQERHYTDRIAECFDTGGPKIYSWVEWFDTDKLLWASVSDNRRSGGNGDLSGNKLEEFREALHKSSREDNCHKPVYTAKLVGTISKKRTVSSTRYRAAGGCSKKPQLLETASSGRKAMSDDREEFVTRPSKKQRPEVDASLVCIDQIKTSVNDDLTQTWFVGILV